MTAVTSVDGGGERRATCVTDRPAVAAFAPGKARTSTIAAAMSRAADVDMPELNTMTRRARTIALAYYEDGFVHGVAAGRQQLEAEWFGRQEVSAAIARRMAKAGSFDALCEARGESERAARHRALMAERGIFPC